MSEDILNKRMIDLTAGEYLEFIEPKIKAWSKEATMEVMNHVNEDLISREEAQEILGLGDSTFCKWISSGRLKKYGKTKEGEFSRAECERKKKFGRHNKEAA